MKLKVFALSIAMVACVFSASAQEEKLGSDYFIGVGGGIHSVYTNHFNTISGYVDIQAGKYFTPLWGARAVLAGPFQRYDKMNQNTWAVSGKENWEKKQLFGEINFDGIINMSHLFSKASIPVVDFLIFAGPTVNLASKCSEFTGDRTADGQYVVAEAKGLKARWGATAGFGLYVNCNKYIAIGVEGRTGVTPSVFGDASVSRKCENTNRLTLNLVYTIGGKLGKEGFAKKYGRVEKVVEQVEVPVEVVKEVQVEKVVEKVVEVANPAATSVFFQLGKANLTDKDKVRLSQFAEAIKAGSKDMVYKISGYADKATGSAKINQSLSEKRAQVVYDFLVSEGVNPSQLEKVANGGVDPLFYNNNTLSRVAIIAK